MKYLLTIISTLFFYALTAQTFSMIVDPVEGDETTLHQNLMYDIAILNEKIYGTAQHFCNSNPASNGSIACSSISSFSLQGEHNKSILIDTFFNGRLGSLLVDDERIFLAHRSQDGSSLEKSLHIHEFDSTLNLVERHLIPSIMNSSMHNDGLKRIGDNYYVYGSSNYPSITRGFIQKLDLDFNLIWTKEYNHGESINGCDKLQKTDGDNLIFAHQYNKGQTGTASNSGLQIMKIDSDGTKLDSLQLNVSSHGPISLLSDSEDMIYVYTDDHPSPSSALELSQGSLNKYSNNLDTLVWSLGFPHNNYIDGRTYYIRTIKEARNGDILVCGSVFDRELYSLFLEQENHTDNGFIARVTKEGEISWLRIYKSPNTDPNLPSEEFGDFHHSLFADLVELEDGRIIAGGSSYLTTPQLSVLVGTTDPLSKFIIMGVDGVTGCIEGEECDEIIILDHQYRPRDNYLSILNANYIWTTDQFSSDGSINTLSYTFSEDSIFQTTNHYHEQIDIETIDDPEQNIVGYFRELGGRIYQKFEGDFNEKIVFDVHLQVGENIEVYRGENSPVELEVIATDTITLLDEILRKRILLKCISDQMSDDTIVWIEGIGELDSSQGCEVVEASTQLQCVQEKSGATVYSRNTVGCQGTAGVCISNTFQVGDTWTYSDFDAPGGIGPATFEIVDEVEWQGRQALMVKPGLLLSNVDYMYQEGGRVYFWNENLEEYQLNYDFNNDSLYHVRFLNYTLNEVDSFAVTIDSVKTNDFNGQSIEIQYISSPGFSGLEVYKGVGLGILGPRIPFNIVDVGKGDIRCFDSSECDVNFSGMPCDTFIISVFTDDLNSDTDDTYVYPNPTSERLFVETSLQNWSFQIRNLHNQKVASGFYQESIDVSLLPQGIYFLQLKDKYSIDRAVRFVKQ